MKVDPESVELFKKVKSTGQCLGNAKSFLVNNSFLNEGTIFYESLILAQDERWRRA